MGAHRTIQLNPDLKIEQLVKEIINNPETQIVIEVPPDCSLLTNEINLRLIKFYAEEEEKELIINAVEPHLISLAQRVGISTIQEGEHISGTVKPEEYANPRSIGEAEVAAVPEVKPEAAPRQGRFIPAVLVLLFTLVFAVWWFLQPKTVVMVYPKEQTLEFTTTAAISTAFSDGDIPAGKVPARILEKQSRAVTQVMATGRKMVGITPAIGKVLFINSTNQPVLVAKGSVITGREGVRFLTDQPVLVPKKITKMQVGIAVGEDYGKAEVGITAEKKGAAGNQPAKAITRIEDKYQNYLKVINLAPTFNGTDKQISLVTLDDVKKGEAEVRRQMQIAVPDEAENLVSADYLFLPELVNSEVIRVTNQPEIGGEGESVQVQLDYRVFVLAPAKAGLQKFLDGRFDRTIPLNFEAKKRRIDLVSAKVVSAGEELAKLDLVGRGQIRGVLNARKIKALIKGKTIIQAQEILNRQNEIGEARIKLEQGSKLPAFGWQIKVLFPAGAKAGGGE